MARNSRSQLAIPPRNFDPAGELQLADNSILAELAELAHEIDLEDHDGDDYRARRIWR